MKKVFSILLLLNFVLFVSPAALAEVLQHLSDEDGANVPRADSHQAPQPGYRDGGIIYRVICPPGGETLPDCERPVDDTELMAPAGIEKIPSELADDEAKPAGGRRAPPQNNDKHMSAQRVCTSDDGAQADCKRPEKDSETAKKSSPQQRVVPQRLDNLPTGATLRQAKPQEVNKSAPVKNAKDKKALNKTQKSKPSSTKKTSTKKTQKAKRSSSKKKATKTSKKVKRSSSKKKSVKSSKKAKRSATKKKVTKKSSKTKHSSSKKKSTKKTQKTKPSSGNKKSTKKPKKSQSSSNN